jgi:hypothetical protein
MEGRCKSSTDMKYYDSGFSLLLSANLEQMICKADLDTGIFLALYSNRFEITWLSSLTCQHEHGGGTVRRWRVRILLGSH